MRLHNLSKNSLNLRSIWTIVQSLEPQASADNSCCTVDCLKRGRLSVPVRMGLRMSLQPVLSATSLRYATHSVLNGLSSVLGSPQECWVNFHPFHSKEKPVIPQAKDVLGNAK